MWVVMGVTEPTLASVAEPVEQEVKAVVVAAVALAPLHTSMLLRSRAPLDMVLLLVGPQTPGTSWTPWKANGDNWEYTSHYLRCQRRAARPEEGCH